jgi:photosystem II stability/assembly factor-like uncharacterized protein
MNKFNCFIKILIIVVSTGIAHNSYSQSGWFKQVSNTSSFLRDIFMINSQTGWIAGFNGTILKTTDSGVNWFSQSGDFSRDMDIFHIFFTSSTTGWFSGYTDVTGSSIGFIYKTTNSGNNWFQQYSDGYSHVEGIYFINSQTGWAALDYNSEYTSYILKTTDGGSNWTQTTIGHYAFFVSILFIS